ncbi:MAG TPA: hypothetical protein VG960_01820 [Caulobacteraceae bacterium]|nr:hypothetical protein [Caulobacteraceae bacterium]
MPLAVGAVETMSGSAWAKEVGAGGSGVGARLQAAPKAHAQTTAKMAKAPRADLRNLFEPAPFISPFQRNSTAVASPVWRPATNSRAAADGLII